MKDRVSVRVRIKINYGGADVRGQMSCIRQSSCNVPDGRSTSCPIDFWPVGSIAADAAYCPLSVIRRINSATF